MADWRAGCQAPLSAQPWLGLQAHITMLGFVCDLEYKLRPSCSQGNQSLSPRGRSLSPVSVLELSLTVGRHQRSGSEDEMGGGLSGHRSSTLMLISQRFMSKCQKGRHKPLHLCMTITS